MKSHQSLSSDELETLFCIDNEKRPHESTSVEESKKLYASRGDETERDADRSALNEAGDLRRKKRCQDEKATGNGKSGHKRQLLHVLIQQTRSFIYKKCNQLELLSKG